MHLHGGIAEPKPVEEVKQGIRLEFVGKAQILSIQYHSSWREKILHYFLEIKLKERKASIDMGYKAIVIGSYTSECPQRSVRAEKVGQSMCVRKGLGALLQRTRLT